MENTIMPKEKFTVTRSKEFKRNDIVVFNYYGNDYGAGYSEDGKYPQHWEKRVFRLIALSGDTFEIRDDKVFIDGIHLPLVPTAKCMYHVECPPSSLRFLIDEESGDGRMNPSGDTAFLVKNLTDKEVADLKASGKIYGTSLYSFRSTDLNPFARLSDTSYWTPENYGPLRIPKPGETIEVNDENYWMFHNIPDIQKGPYTVKEPLYFVMGDNRHAAEDSRYIGLIPHNNMYGVVKL